MWLDPNVLYMSIHFEVHNGAQQVILKSLQLTGAEPREWMGTIHHPIPIRSHPFPSDAWHQVTGLVEGKIYMKPSFSPWKIGVLQGFPLNSPWNQSSEVNIFIHISIYISNHIIQVTPARPCASIFSRSSPWPRRPIAVPMAAQARQGCMKLGESRWPHW